MGRSRRRAPRSRALWRARLGLLAAVCGLGLLGGPRGGHPASAEEPLALRDCLIAALEANPVIRSAELEPVLASADYLAAQGLFDPTVTLNYTVTDRSDPLNQRTILALQGVVTAIDSTTTVLAGGIGGVTAAGTQYAVTFNRTRRDSTVNAFFRTSGEYEVDLTGSLTQPLLRNFGIGVTTTNLRVANLERTAAQARLRTTIIDQLFATEQAYWQLVLAREQLRIQQNGRDLAARLVEEMRVRLEVGVVARLAVLEAETALARRAEGVLLATQAVGDAEDGVRRLLGGAATNPAWDLAIVPADAPTLELVSLDVDPAVTEALQARPELHLLRVATEQARLAAAFQKNQRLPEVNLRADYGFRAVALSPDSALDRLFSGNDPNWLLGVEVSVPWGNRAARGAYRRAQLTARGAELELRRTQQALIQDARRAVRQAATGLQQVEATRAAERLARQQLTAEETKLEVGVATPFDVRQKQDDLIDAEGRALEALVGYRISVANLARAQGRYLRRIGVGIAVETAGGVPPLPEQAPDAAGPTAERPGGDPADPPRADGA